MEIKRTIEIFVETRRRIVVRQPEATEQVVCPDCNEAMIGVEAAAALYSINHRTIYRLIENTAAHFAETEAGAVMLCPSSLVALLGDDAGQLPAAESTS